MRARIRARALATAWPLLALLALAIPRAHAAVAPYRPPQPVERTLANGLRVAVFPDSRLPLVQLQVMVPAGSGSDPMDRPGIARITALMLRRGSTTRDAAAMNSAIDRLGKRFDIDASRDYATVSASFLTRDLEAGFDLVGEAVTRPAFPERELEQLKLQTLSAIAQFRQEPVGLVEEQLWRAAFPGHPYSWQPFGAGPTVREMARDQVLAFYFEHYRPDVATLGIAGDITPERAFALAEEHFGRWQSKGETAPPPTPPATAPPRAIIRLVDLPDAPACAIRIGAFAPARADGDRMPLVVATSLLGSGPGSRLAELAASGRLKREARASYTSLRSGGLFTFSAVARPESLGATVSLLREQLQLLAGAAPAPQEIDAVRAYTRALSPLPFETLGGVIGNWSSRVLYGGAAGTDDERIAAVTAAQVGEASRRWLAADRLLIVVAGPAATARPALEAFGTVEVVGPGDVARKAEAEPALAPPTPKEIARGKELIQLALKAHGGATRIGKVRDSRVETQTTLYVGPREIRGRMVQVRKDPDKMIFSTTFEGMSTEQTLNGDRAWAVSAGSLQFMDSLGVQGMRSGFTSDIIHLLRAASARDVKVAARGKETFQGRETNAVEFGEGPNRRMLYLEALTNRVAGLDQREIGPDGEPLVARRIYREYRTVQGVVWPHVEERLFNGERVMLMQVERLALDIGVGDDLFEPKELPLPPVSR